MSARHANGRDSICCASNGCCSIRAGRRGVRPVAFHTVAFHAGAFRSVTYGAVSDVDFFAAATSCGSFSRGSFSRSPASGSRVSGSRVFECHVSNGLTGGAEMLSGAFHSAFRPNGFAETIGAPVMPFDRTLDCVPVSSSDRRFNRWGGTVQSTSSTTRRRLQTSI
jgi:hypothetical protein